MDKIVKDVYSLLDKLNNSESIDGILEPHIEKFGEDMKEVIRHWAKVQDKDGKDNLRMSNVGKPNRQLWYDVNLNNEDQNLGKMQPYDQLKFLYGHLVEAILLMLVEASGHEVSCQQDRVEVEGIKGSMDSVIDGEVIDIKSASPYGFKKFANGTLAEDDPFGYIPQLAGYEKDKGTNNGGFLVMNKVTGELCLHRPEVLDKPNIVGRIKEAKEVVANDNPPEELCYPDIEDGKSGNMKINRGCNYCKYKEICRSDANNGQGLRKFKYSDGIRYLTRVIKEPKVEEIK